MSMLSMILSLAVNPFFPCFPIVDCVLLLFATIDPTSEGEEGYEGEDFAGEGPGQPGTTGKPPLALAYLIPIFLCICFGL